MSVFAEFCCVALALFLWESLLWLPLRSAPLHFSRKNNTVGIKVRRTDRWFATKKRGCVFLSWLPGSCSVLPCQAIPFMVDSQDRWLLHHDDGHYASIPAPTWEQIRWQHPTFHIGNARVTLTSGLCLVALWRGKNAGLSPAEATRMAWRESLSLPRAAADEKKWRLLAAPFSWMQSILLLIFVSGIFGYWEQREQFPVLIFLASVVLLMLIIAIRVAWMAKKIDPSCRSALIQDAFLCCIVPFHAMRASEAIALQFMGRVNSLALLLRYEPQHPWLAQYLRKISHPRPGKVEDEMLFDAMSLLLQPAMQKRGMQWSDYDQAPISHQPDEVRYCPRCHTLYLAGQTTCHECNGYPLRHFS
jgi:hypothetical protein